MPINKNNANLKPERTRSVEAGVEANFMNGRFGFDASYYRSTSVDQIMAVDVSTTTGYGRNFVNAGTVRNEGVEVSAFVLPVRSTDFSWTLNLNWSRNRNQVVELYGTNTNLQLATFQGGVTLNATVGQPFGTLRGRGFVYVNGEKQVGEDGYYTFGPPNTIIGDVNPDWQGGIQNNLRYKDFSLSFLIDIKKGGSVFSLDQYYGQATGIYPESAGLNDLGNPKRVPISEGGGVILPGVDADGNQNTVRVEAYDNAVTPYGYSNNPQEAFVYDAGFVKLREAAITYSLPKKWIGEKAVKGVDVSLVGRNLWLIHSNVPYSDPEAGLSSGNIQGYQSGAYPAVRTLGFNVKVDEKNPSQVSATSLFGNALKELSDNQTTSSINVNLFRLWTQQWTTTTYQDEPRYDFVTRNTPLAYWTPFYREVLQDLKECRRLTEEDTDLSAEVKSNRLAVAEVVAVYTWSILVNTWGDVPYSEALTTVTQPKYDKAADIYADLFTRLDAAIASLTPGANFGSTDLLYNNDTAAWIKFANSLKMKLAITVADVDETLARTAITAAAPNAFTSNADNATFQYLGAIPNNNPISNQINPSFTTRQDFIAGATLVNKMNATNDPRRPFYYTTVGGNYVGGLIGVNNNYANYSHISDRIADPTFESLLMDYAEVEFILAEAAARWGILGTPADHYQRAVTASIIYWGGTAGQATAYLAQPSVAYATAPGDFRQKIGEQKYIDFFNRGYDSWVEWRRLDYPRLTPAANAEGPMPLRLTYPTSERTLNGANVEAAASSIGGDEVDTKIFWDVR